MTRFSHARPFIATVMGLTLTAGAMTASAWATPARHATAAPPPKLIHAGILTVGSDTTYPPMESSDVNHPGTYIGADVDLAKALAKAMGLKGARIVSTSFPTIIASLRRGNFDVIMSSMNDTPERRKQITFVDYMQLKGFESVLVPKSSSLHVKSYHGLCGHSVSAQNGTAELDDLNKANKACGSKKMTIKSYDADTAAFQSLASGHVDAYTTDLPVGLFYLKSHTGAIRFAGKAFGGGAKYGIGVQKSNPGLRAAVARALKKIHANGQYMKILRKFGLGSTAL